MLKRSLKLCALTAVFAGMLAGMAAAATTSANLPVSADVSNVCNFGTINTLSFTYDPVVANASTDATSSANFNLTCTTGDSITIGLDLGQHNASGQRQMQDSGTDKLSYNLFQNSNHSTAWDDSSNKKSDTATGSAVAYTVYGVVPHAQNVPAGSYTDTVAINVTY
jgi:spore coat protein U-like protein